MKTVAVLIAAIVVVECMPRPDGLGGPGLAVPTGDNDNSVQPDANVNDNGEVEVKQTKTTYTESSDKDSQSNAEGYQHKGPNGESVSQSSERNSSHSESEKQKETESDSVKLGPDGGVMMTKDKSSTKERDEENTETGRQSFKQSSGNNPDHKHRYESGSEFENSNRTHDKQHDESHDQFGVGPDLATQSEHSETHTEEHDEEQRSRGGSYTRQEDYDRNGNNVRHTGSASQSNYDNKAAKSSSNSTSKHEESSSGGGESNINNNGDGSGGIDLYGDSDGTNDQNGQTNAEVESQTNVNGQTDNDNTESEIGMQPDQAEVSDAGAQTDGSDQNSDLNVVQGGQTDQDNSGGLTIQDGSSDSNVDQDGQSNQDNSWGLNTGDDGQADTNVGGEGQVDVNSENKTDTSSTANESGNEGVGVGTGPKFGIEDIFRQLDRDERVLGLNTEVSSVESTESPLEANKVRNDYLLTVAQSIHNSKIVNDGKGNARVVTPYWSSDEFRNHTDDFLQINAPYRTLAQRFGPSPVSSHYANAEFIESRFGNLPSIFGFSRKYDKLQKAGNTGKSQLGVRHLFERPNIEYENVVNLQFTPLEWEMYARKKTDLTVMDDHKTKSFPGLVTKISKIDPLVKNVILSRNLDDILKTAKSPEEVSAAMKTFTLKKGEDITVPTNKQTETHKKNEANTFSNENEINGHNKDTPVGKTEYEVFRPYRDPTEDISQVITNRVDLINSHNIFDPRIHSGHRVKYNLSSEFKHLEESFDNATERYIAIKNTNEIKYLSENVNTSSNKDVNEKFDVLRNDFQTNENIQTTEKTRSDNSVTVNSTITEKESEQSMINDEGDMDAELTYPESETETNMPDNEDMSSFNNNTMNNYNNVGSRNEAINLESNDSNFEEINKDLEYLYTTDIIETKGDNRMTLTYSTTESTLDSVTETNIYKSEATGSTTLQKESITDLEISEAETQEASINFTEMANTKLFNKEKNSSSTENNSVRVDVIYNNTQFNTKSDTESNITVLINKSVADAFFEITHPSTTDNNNVAVITPPTTYTSNEKITDSTDYETEKIFARSALQSNEMTSAENSNSDSEAVVDSNDTRLNSEALQSTEISDSNTYTNNASINFETKPTEVNSSVATDTSDGDNIFNVNNRDLPENTTETPDVSLPSLNEETKNTSITKNMTSNTSSENTNTSTIQFSYDSDGNETLTAINKLEPTEVSPNERTIVSSTPPDKTGITTAGTVNFQSEINTTPLEDDNKGSNSFISSESNFKNTTDGNIVNETTENGTMVAINTNSVIVQNKSNTMNDNISTTVVEPTSTVKTIKIVELNVISEATTTTTDENSQTSKVESDETDISDESKVTVKRELFFEKSSEEMDAGTDNSISNTDVDSSSAALVDNNDESIKNGPVGNNDKADELTIDKLTSAKTNELEATNESNKAQYAVKSDASVKSDTNAKSETSINVEPTTYEAKSDTSVKTEVDEGSVKIDNFLETVKSGREKEESKGEIEEYTSKSDESRNVSMERFISAITDYSSSGSAER